ncbi:MAG: hypothetical protein ACLP1X_34620 [Polyangiaceae bacterium]|jgi:hypothetical protein
MNTRTLLSIGLAVGFIAAACGGSPNGGGFPPGDYDGGSTGDDGPTDEGGSTGDDSPMGDDVMTGNDDSGSGGGSVDSGGCNASTCAACVSGTPCCTSAGACACTFLGVCL